MEPVKVVTCGPAVNESERNAIEQLKTRLISEQPEGEWLLLTNLPFSATHRRQSDEIDILAIGPPGVRVVEVKHWSADYAKRNREQVQNDADLVTSKAKKVGTTLRRNCPEVGRVDGVFLLTESATRAQGVGGPVRGVPFHTIKAWRDVLNYDAPSVLSAYQVRALGATLTPKSPLATDGRLKRLAGYANLHLQTPAEERFHRVYKATHSSSRDKVILHLYDCSASDAANAEHKARREFEALRRLRLFDWAPGIVESFQPLPGYHGEVHFFTVVDPAAPSIQQRASDASWCPDARLAYARSATRALQQLHEAGYQGEAMLHRNLTPETLLVKHDNSPVITGFDQARIPTDVTIATAQSMDSSPTTAPEVRKQGRGAADRRSDVYSLCASLMTLFEPSHEVAEVLGQGMVDEPNARPNLLDLSRSLARLLGESPRKPPAPPVRFWTEDQQVPFQEHEYRIVSRLGSGGIGTTFKVVELDPKTGADLGAYVAKAIHRSQDAERVMSAYRLVRPHSGDHPALSTVYQYARDWQDNGLVALMTWVEGEPLDECAGLMAIHAEDRHEATDEALAIRWLKTAASALGTLHRHGLVHGDVSPRNIIVSEADIVLTDYDCATKVGESYAALGTVTYSSPSLADGASAQPSDDIYALAASFFYALFERQPFLHGGNLTKDRGLNWAGIDRDAYPVLTSFLDRATDPEREKRYATVEEALRDLTVRPSERVAETDVVAVVAASASQSTVANATLENSGRGQVDGHPLDRTQQVNRLLDQMRAGRVTSSSGRRKTSKSFGPTTTNTTDIIRAIRSDRHQSWKNLRKAVRAQLGLPHEPFGTANVAAHSRSTVRKMQREAGVSWEHLLEILDSM